MGDPTRPQEPQAGLYQGDPEGGPEGGHERGFEQEAWGAPGKGSHAGLDSGLGRDLVPEGGVGGVLEGVSGRSLEQAPRGVQEGFLEGAHRGDFRPAGLTQSGIAGVDCRQGMPWDPMMQTAFMTAVATAAAVSATRRSEASEYPGVALLRTSAD